MDQCAISDRIGCDTTLKHAPKHPPAFVDLPVANACLYKAGVHMQIWLHAVLLLRSPAEVNGLVQHLCLSIHLHEYGNCHLSWCHSNRAHFCEYFVSHRHLLSLRAGQKKRVEGHLVESQPKTPALTEKRNRAVQLACIATCLYEDGVRCHIRRYRCRVHIIHHFLQASWIGKLSNHHVEHRVEG